MFDNPRRQSHTVTPITTYTAQHLQLVTPQCLAVRCSGQSHEDGLCVDSPSCRKHQAHAAGVSVGDNITAAEALLADREPDILTLVGTHAVEHHRLCWQQHSHINHQRYVQDWVPHHCGLECVRVLADHVACQEPCMHED